MGKSRLKPQFWRWQKIDEMIRANTYPNCRQISEKTELSQRTILRDVEYMKDTLGSPIEYDRNRYGYYYTQKNWGLPSIRMTQGDFFTLSVANKIMAEYKVRFSPQRHGEDFRDNFNIIT